MKTMFNIQQMYLKKDTNVGICSTIISTTMSNIVITSIKDSWKR